MSFPFLLMTLLQEYTAWFYCMLPYHTTLFNLFNRAKKLCLDIICPPACWYCKKFLSERQLFCQNCAQHVRPVVPIKMPITATKSVMVFAATAYQEPIKKLIVSKRWGDISACAALAELMWQNIPLDNLQVDFFVPIPLHWTRRVYRGYNQADEIAHQLAKKGGKKMALILKRIKLTSYQSGLRSDERLANVKDAFELVGADMTLYKDKHLVIVDDLMTTGSTLRVAIKKLFELKPASITVVVASRVI